MAIEPSGNARCGGKPQGEPGDCLCEVSYADTERKSNYLARAIIDRNALAINNLFGSSL